MADFGSPVGTNVYNPQQTLGTLSGLIGVKQQQQALQTGAYQQQTAQAQAEQNQMDLAERNAASDVLRNPDKYGGLNPDGSTNAANMMTHIMQVAPKVGPTLLRPVIQMERDTTAFAKEAQGLNDQQKESAGNALSGLAQGNFKDTGEFLKAFDTVKKASTPAVSNLLDQMLDHPEAQQSQGSPTVQALQARATALARTTQPAASNMPQPANINTGGTIKSGLVAPGTGAFTPGSAMPTTLTPGERLPQRYQTSTQEAGVYDPTNPNKAGLVGSGAAPTLGGPPQRQAPPAVTNPSAAQATMQNTAASGVAARLQTANAQANSTTQSLDALSRARDILDKGTVMTGGGFGFDKGFKNQLASLGINADSITDTNSLVKNLARYEASRATASGLGGTDAARELAHAGSPNTQIDSKALKGIVEQSMASEMALNGYTKALNGTTDPQQAVQKETAFRSVPNLVKAYQYGLSRSPQEADQFLKEHDLSKAEVAASRAKLRELGAL